MSIKREYDFDEWRKDMYLLHHEEIELLPLMYPRSRIRFYDLQPSYLTHMKCENVGMLSTTPILFEG